MSLFLSNLEYISLRLIRKFIFSRGMMDRLHRFIPHYQPTAAQFDPQGILAPYWQYLDVTNKTVLELGSGTTNGVGKVMVSRGGAFCYCYEPLVPFNSQLDQRFNQGDPEKVKRVVDLSQIPDNSIDLVLSIAVLEHVYDLDGLLKSMKPKLRPNAVQLHVVDFRDHFFKYPLHFLQFSPWVWQTFLDPGNMPRHRLGDVWECFNGYGFAVTMLKRVVDREGLAALRGRVDPCFAGYHGDDLATVEGVLGVEQEVTSLHGIAQDADEK